MTDEEFMKELMKEFDKFLNELDKKAKFYHDEILLLSAEEYEKYKETIPHINQWWWLRSPGEYPGYATFVGCEGSVDCVGAHVYDDIFCVRPALRIVPNNFLENLPIGSRFVKYDFPWFKIDDNLAIAEAPIGFEKFDDESNSYAISYIRKWLKEWLEARK